MEADELAVRPKVLRMTVVLENHDANEGLIISGACESHNQETGKMKIVQTVEGNVLVLVRDPTTVLKTVSSDI